MLYFIIAVFHWQATIMGPVSIVYYFLLNYHNMPG